MTEQIVELKQRLVVGRKRDGRNCYDAQAKRELIEACLRSGVSVAKLALTLITTLEPRGPAAAVVLTDGKRFAQRLSVSQVRFRRLDDEEIHHYVSSGEAADKAGAYGIQGRAAMFIEEIRGSYSGIMGLPLFETAALLQEFGYSL